jgi:hypothetical protein
VAAMAIAEVEAVMVSVPLMGSVRGSDGVSQLASKG